MPSTPPTSSPPALPSEPPIRIWEDHREWTGERRTPTPSRIPIPRTPSPIFEGEWSRPTPPSSPVWPIVGGVLGRAIGGIVGIFWPTEMGDGELTPEQQREGRERYEASEEAKADAIRADELEYAIRNLEAARASQWPGRYHRPQDPDAVGGIMGQEYPQPVIEPNVPTPVPRELTPPSPAIHTPSSRSSSSSSSSPTPSQARVPRPTSSPSPSPSTFGQELLEALLEGLLSGASSWARNRARTIAQEALSQPTPAPAMPANPFVDPLTPPRIPGLDPLTPPRGNPLTSSNPMSVGSGAPSIPRSQETDQDRCRTKPKKRKKPRKCAAKAGLRWVGGPKSGELAGSRCYAFKGD
jgi:hypothetical protein